MAEPYIADIVGQYQRGQAFGTEQRKAREGEQQQSRLSELASLAYGAQNPEERRSYVSQAIGNDASTGLALGQSLAKDDESQQMELVKAIRLVGMYPEAQQPEAYRRVVGQLRQRFPGLPIPDEIDDNARKALAAVNSAYGGGDKDLSERYRVVGGALVDLQDPSKPVYVAPIQTDTGLVEGGPQGFRQITLGGPPSPSAPAPGPVVENSEGERGRWSIAQDGRPVFIAEGVSPNIEQGITADPAAFQKPTAEAPGQFIGGQPQGQPILPRGASDARERLELARDANRLANEAAEARRRAEADRQQFGTIAPGYRPNADRTALERVPGAPAPASATPTVDEKTAATLLQRLAFSEKQLEQAVKEVPSAASPSVGAEIVRGLPFVGDVAANTVTPANRQRVEAAQLDILDAALTLGTGAAYTREQLEGYRKAYFPQIGDDPDTIADKQARLKNVISAARIKAGRAAPAAGGGTSGGPAPSPAPDARRRALLDKY